MAKALRIHLAVWATIPIDPFDGQPDLSEREVEKAVIKALTRVGFDTDAEVMNSEEIDE